MTEYALFFESGGPVFGDGFVASVQVRGRLLAIRTAEDCELYGVNPGGFAVYADTLNEAYARFVEDLRLVLVDIAAEGCTFEHFQRRARVLFSTSGPRTRERWKEARERARRGEIENDLGLRVEQQHPELGIEVELVEKPLPSVNSAPQEHAPTAVAA